MFFKKNNNKNKFHKKIIITAVLFLFVFSLIGTTFLIPQPAQAFVETGISGIIMTTWNKIKDAVVAGWKKTNDQLWKTGLKQIINKTAAQMGTYLATGGKGQKSLILADTKKYLKEAADGVAGDYINNIAKGILGGTCQGVVPKKTCKTDDDCPDLVAGTCKWDSGIICIEDKGCPVHSELLANTLNFTTQAEWDNLSVEVEKRKKNGEEVRIEGDNYVSYKTGCNISNTKSKCIIKGFNLCEVDFRARASLIGGVKAEFTEYESECPLSKMSEHYKELRDLKFPEDWVDFQAYFNPEANDIGAHLAMTAQIYDSQQEKVVTEEKKIVDATLPLTEKISGDTKTPAGAITAARDSTNEKTTTAEEKQTGSPWADAFGIFMKSFANTWLKNLFEKGLVNKDNNPDLSPSSSTASWTSIKAAEKIYSSMFTAPIISSGNYDILTNYLTCPEDINFAQMDNCVLNQEMGTFLQNNERISFQDAIDKNKENGSYNWINAPVGKDGNKILSKGDQNEGFSLANIKKMRKARIVPLGLELAAKKIIESSEITSKSLKEIVEKFNNNSKVCSNNQSKTCAEDVNCPEGTCNIQPFYHLVDPNWILKVPQHQCEAKVFGQTLETAQSTQRSSVCVDLKSCLKEDAEGNCQGVWGYCVREKNIWRFDGDQCPERFNTCQTFQKENQNISYLKNTLDYNGCDSSNSGCLWYSKTKKTDDRIYFNKNIQACATNNDGCHKFIQLTNINDNKTNADVLKTVQDANKITCSIDADCLSGKCEAEKCVDDYYNYATINEIYLNKNRIQCNEKNAGCEKYTPTDRSPYIPGIVKVDNICPQECVGYKNYHQLKTNFENESYVNLIPNGKQCSSNEVGCDEFTNLDEVAKGGEGKEYYTNLRHCVKTGTSSCGVFYTWVGSDTQGFQLKAYNLQKDGSAPKITNVSMDLGPCEIEADAINNPECKEFFDELGNPYYKIYKKTITCSEDCHPLRKTNVVLTELDCKNYGGTWQNDQCIFMAIPKEGTTCSANGAGCRAYRGNHGDNIRIILQDDFEDGNFEGWEKAVITNEASVIGGHSIKSDNNLIQSSPEAMPSLLIQNKSYEISFWAKSGGAIAENAEVKFNNDETILSFRTQSVGTEWNKYTFGPLLYNRPVSETEKLEIVGNVYIDNISLKEITNDIYLIKNSWNIPTSCDQTLKGESLLQVMLNCAEYQDRRGAFQYLKSFALICDEKLIGCQTLIDTQNSISPYEQTIKGIKISKDSLAYVVNNPLNYCPSQEKGCESFGLPDLNVKGGDLCENDSDCLPGKCGGDKKCEVVKTDKEGKQIWKDVYLKNNPDQYKTIICSDKEMSCQEYKYNNGNAIAYFKDLKDKVCEYKMVVGQENYGWYKKGTESGAPDCETDGKILAGWVGICSENHSGCTQFIDPLDNQSFYYLNNDKIDRNSPNGLVSKKEGKILFNDTSKTELIYDADATYNESEKQNKAVSPVTDCNSPSCFNGAVLKEPLPDGCKKDVIKKCTANSLIKVARDRVCGQWLSCENSTEIFSEGKKKKICDKNGLCREFADNSSSECSKLGWVIAKTGEECINDLDCLSGRCKDKRCAETISLTEENYQNRNILWGGLDYSGYSIADQYPIFTLDQINYQKKGETIPNWKLAYKTQTEENAISKSCRAYPEATSPFLKSMSNQDGFQNANFCSQEEEKDDACECSYIKVETTDYNFAYFQNSKSEITGICTDGIDDKTKKTKMGILCSSDNDCGIKGRCNTIKKLNQYLGWKGYCLEKDLNTQVGNENACLTWYPSDLVSGEINTYINSIDAGFNPGSVELGFGSGPYYCLKKEGNFEWRTEKNYTDDDRWLTWWFGTDCGGCLKGYYQSRCHTWTKWFKTNAEWTCVPNQGEGCYEIATDQRNSFIKDSAKCNGLKICTQIVATTEKGTAWSESNAWTDRIWKDQKIPKFITKNNFIYDTKCGLFGALPTDTTMPIKDKSVYLYQGGQCGTYVGVNDYEKNILALQEIFAKSMKFYKWQKGEEKYKIKVCDENSYNYKSSPYTFCNENANCRITGECKANTCDNGLGQKALNNENPPQEYYTGNCNPDFDCLAGVICNAGKCNDENKSCVNNNQCSSNKCEGMCNDGITKCESTITCPTINNTQGVCNNMKCTLVSCNPNSQCNNKEVKKCPEGDYILSTQTISDCMQKCIDENPSYLVDLGKKCKDGTEPKVQIGNLTEITNGICRTNKFCVSGTNKNACSNPSDCSNEKGLCVEKEMTMGSPGISQYIETDQDITPWNITKEKGVNNSVQIQAIDIEGCKVTENWCPAAINGIGKFTINGKYNREDIVGGEGVLSAVVKFYAWVDKNQMPIKEIVIDWGDGAKSTSSGLFKNHKEECEKIDPDFGDSSQACTETYFQYSHVYVCNQENGCTFIPKISVKDNWGWCTNGKYAGDNITCSSINGQITFAGKIIVEQ
ncbi:hypothetical protein HY750_01750 [Candidatus Kuenenbacteria bacterium]|nr:hypothetical protein [Candidatus Kuenenbacteria bacterium]